MDIQKEAIEKYNSLEKEFVHIRNKESENDVKIESLEKKIGELCTLVAANEKDTKKEQNRLKTIAQEMDKKVVKESEEVESLKREIWQLKVTIEEKDIKIESIEEDIRRVNCDLTKYADKFATDLSKYADKFKTGICEVSGSAHSSESEVALPQCTKCGVAMFSETCTVCKFDPERLPLCPNCGIMYLYNGGGADTCVACRGDPAYQLLWPDYQIQHQDSI